jgi:hypothetical protein
MPDPWTADPEIRRVLAVLATVTVTARTALTAFTQRIEEGVAHSIAENCCVPGRRYGARIIY